MTGFAPDLFAGTAEYYEGFRPRYPDVMLSDLLERVSSVSWVGGADKADSGGGADKADSGGGADKADSGGGVDRSGRVGTVVDIACGTGQIAVPLSRHVDRVLAVDLEPDMIDVGRAVADKAGITNISWQVGRAEDLDIDAHSVDLLTIGNAFHRLDRELIAAKAKEWLSPRGALVVMGYGIHPNSSEAKPPWQVIMSRVTRKWVGPLSEAARRALAGPFHEEMLTSAGYEIEQHEWMTPRRWTLDELVGLTFSISISSKRVLGDRADAFEAELRSELLGYDELGEYDEELRFFAIIARPGSSRPAEGP